ncbi:hypothetical protein NPX13_g11465 [Xylaria arbuscula]|uniref:HTH psq-type domain-containing protein n=1 Tax=Xylaria arbuscula TaxID=114810 RepID=A0A9W8TGH0_9PEZI|nr:hypothetical protein NPX13_g11465 [Xylaria arbuscula]
MALIQNESQLLLAIQAIEKDPKLSIRAAHRIYAIPYTTLYDRIHGLQYILDLDARAFPPRLAGVEDMANRLLRDRDAPPVAKRWASNFVKRQPELRTRFDRKYDYQRAQCEDPDALNAWF